ncbi:hypothetical protein ETAA8_41700 [Anatilimnocola aggregata]|uniref:Uncharacterized protein n=1 Tax=Anatilimnocola aggregata TaxID=2528021 RepID=A0A517YFQ5_9BACT|nr:hypothetical protein ETAA8_41700 [Anatilimnocola aggregata]
MSAVWKSTCSCCGERHTFHFRDADVLPRDQAYEFVCPTTTELTLYADDDCEWPHVNAARPEDAVDVRFRGSS